ncbi:efflux transporter outer membrane subunit [Ewingella americana]|uniref:efflux transporter outer membrane subunit n=1 Tax=Ewingella americana TaxID=41202 RepID=UPI0012ADAAA7|nr:efflux transporter outer membrane subunit [Ewingella americana]MRT03560.1 efflux transporter outer membrane subunit [Ewingella americana]
MFPLRTLALLVSAGVLAGCTVGPDYHRPDSPLPQQYQTSIGSQQATRPANFALWWQGFDDPLLSRLVGEALAQNLSLAQASARMAQAGAGVSAATAELLPSGNISGQAARGYQSIDTPLGQVLNSTPDYNRYGNSYESDLNASWEIDIFGGLRRSRQAAVADYQAAQADVVATRLAVAAQTADRYISLRGLQARLAIAQQQANTQQELLQKIQLLNSKGLAAEYQVQQTAGELAQVQATVPALQTQVDAAMNALDVMLGTPAGTHRAELSVPGAIPQAPKLTDTGTPADLLRRRPDIIVAERHLAASSARIGVAVSEYYPKFSLGALLGSATVSSGGNLLSGGATQSAAILGLRWRLFDFGRINAQINQAKGQEAESLAAYRQTVLHATEDVENAFSALVNSQTQTSTLTVGENALGSARKSTFAAFQQGTASLIDVLHADETLLQASDARAQAQTASARAAVAAFNALGGGWQPPQAVAKTQ